MYNVKLVPLNLYCHLPGDTLVSWDVYRIQKLKIPKYVYGSIELYYNLKHLFLLSVSDSSKGRRAKTIDFFD
jgi:hypothetical protein